MKRSKVCIRTKSTLASLLFKGLATKHTTVKWSIHRIGARKSSGVEQGSARDSKLRPVIVKVMGDTWT